MAEVIGFFLIIAVVVFFPYRLVYHRLNRIMDAQMVFTGAALIVFAAICSVDSASLADSKGFLDRFNNTGAKMVQALCWIMALAGTSMIGFAIWGARERRKERLAKKSSSQKS